MDYLLQIFKALANERRLKMIEFLLDRGELSIEEIARNLRIPNATCGWVAETIRKETK